MWARPGSTRPSRAMTFGSASKANARPQFRRMSSRSALTPKLQLDGFFDGHCSAKNVSLVFNSSLPRSRNRKVMNDQTEERSRPITAQGPGHSRDDLLASPAQKRPPRGGVLSRDLPTGGIRPILADKASQAFCGYNCELVSRCLRRRGRYCLIQPITRLSTTLSGEVSQWNRCEPLLHCASCARN